MTTITVSDSVEGQDSYLAIQINPYSGRDWAWNFSLNIIVKKTETWTGELQAPGFVITPKSAVVTISLPFNVIVCNCNGDLTIRHTTPLNLPVGMFRKSIATKYLSAVGETIPSPATWHNLVTPFDFCVVFRYKVMSECSCRIKLWMDRIWDGKDTEFQCVTQSQNTNNWNPVITNNWST